MSAQSTTSLWLPCKLLCFILMLCCLMDEKGLVSSADEEEERPIAITHTNKGKDTEFNCTVQNLGKRKLIWRRLSDPYPISVGSSRFTPDKRYSVGKVNPSTYKLTIKNAGAKDAGEYECRVSGGEGLAEIITLIVKGGPKRPYLKETKTELKADEGDTVLLPCEVENLSGKMVLWKNDKNEVLTLRRKNYIGDRSLRVIHDTAPQWSLQIQKVQKWHFGHYTCIINSNPVITRTVHLKQMVAPKAAPKLIRDSSYKLEVKAMPGDLVTLTCKFRANPPAIVSWYRRFDVAGESKKEVLGQGNTLTLRSVRPEQTGTYFCVGKNNINPNGRGRTRLIVEAPMMTVPPTTTTTVIVPTGPIAPHMYHRGNQYNVRLGYDTTLTCSVIAQPRATIHWYRHGHRLSDDHKYEVDYKLYGRYNTTGTLHIRALSSRDFGDYKCNGYNELGIKSLHFKVIKEK